MPNQLIAGSANLTTKIRYLTGISLTENGGTPAAARVTMRDGSSSGPILLDVQIPASGNFVRDLARPLYFPNGLYLQVTPGTVRGSVSGT